MAGPRGTQRPAVMQACNDLPDGLGRFCQRSEIADTPEFDWPMFGCASRAPRKQRVSSVPRLVEDSGYKALITSNGRLFLKDHQPLPDKDTGTGKKPQTVKVIPKGLRSYDRARRLLPRTAPGPRCADGLPESIHFWKVRIEETDPDKTFSVGVIEGPSGCGKSSLVKAGLLPRLPKPMIPVYVEATAGETEARLLKGLRKHIPDMPPISISDTV